MKYIYNIEPEERNPFTFWFFSGKIITHTLTIHRLTKRLAIKDVQEQYGSDANFQVQPGYHAGVPA